MALRTVARQRPLWWLLEEKLRDRLHSLAYVETGRRDLRVDFLRGLAAAVMIVDHVGGDSLLTRLTGGNQYIVSAAEGFVFLSGLVLGMVYSERIKRYGPATVARSLIQRAATLYKASAGMALAFLVLFLTTDLRLWIDRQAGVTVLDPVETVVGILTLHYAFHGSDVLAMYTVMLLVAPGILYLLYRGRTAAVLLGSLALWALYQHYPEEATVPWKVIDSYFPISAWQLLFVLGMVAGYHRARLARGLLHSGGASRLAVLASGAGAYLLALSYELYASSTLPAAWLGGASYGSLFDKTGLGPGRVLTFLSIMIMAFVIVHALWLPLRATLAWLLLPLGQNSLYAYIMHLFVVVLLYNSMSSLMTLVPPADLNLAAQLLGLGLVWIMVRTHFLFALVPR